MAIDHYGIGDSDELKFNNDVSLTLYIQRESPGKGKESNCLPTLKPGGFSMIIRLYWPKDIRIVIVKSANHFRAWWPNVASEIIDSDPPGIASNDLSAFAFKRKTRKMYPLDKDAVYPQTTDRCNVKNRNK